jgi:hypothetical protein
MFGDEFVVFLSGLHPGFIYVLQDGRHDATLDQWNTMRVSGLDYRAARRGGSAGWRKGAEAL